MPERGDEGREEEPVIPLECLGWVRKVETELVAAVNVHVLRGQ